MKLTPDVQSRDFLARYGERLAEFPPELRERVEQATKRAFQGLSELRPIHDAVEERSARGPESRRFLDDLVIQMSDQSKLPSRTAPIRSVEELEGLQQRAVSAAWAAMRFL